MVAQADASRSILKAARPLPIHSGHRRRVPSVRVSPLDSWQSRPRNRLFEKSVVNTIRWWEPLWPSQLKREIHLIKARAERTLRFANVSALKPLGVDVEKYESFECRATQAIAAAAHFLEFDGLLVSSARAPCPNPILFPDRVAQNGHLELRTFKPVDWDAWRQRRNRTP